MYIYDCGLPKSHWKVTDGVDKMITDEASSVSSDCYWIALCAIGYISGILGLMDIIKGDKKQKNIFYNISIRSNYFLFFLLLKKNEIF